MNIQIPLYALGYHVYDITENHYDDLDEDASSQHADLIISMYGKEFDDYIAGAYAYNAIYSQIEFQLDAENISETLKCFEEILIELRNQSPGDNDYTALTKYLNGIQKLRANE